MRRILILLLFPLISVRGLALEVLPALSSDGQALEIRCRQDEPECQEVCGGAVRCVRSESRCPLCAGTGSLRMKRILDAVGGELRARPPERSMMELMRLLAAGGWITLHARTLYNFSSPWNGSSIHARFRQACDLVSTKGAEGLVFLRVDEGSPQPGSVLGILCQDAVSGEVTWWGSERNKR